MGCVQKSRNVTVDTAFDAAPTAWLLKQKVLISMCV